MAILMAIDLSWNTHFLCCYIDPIAMLRHNIPIVETM
ncbi:Uncharacterised protein [Mycobacterium tuberculosis]|nr:Uncharacterised protein [Mycobacterium tuberculosis]